MEGEVTLNHHRPGPRGDGNPENLVPAPDSPRMGELAANCRGPVDPRFRSNVSIRFHLPSRELETDFLAEASAAGLLHLQGHPDVGGMRASLYNLVSLEAVEALSQFMAEFRRRRG